MGVGGGGGGGGLKGKKEAKMAKNYLVMMYKLGDPMLSITYSDQECHTGVEKAS